MDKRHELERDNNREDQQQYEEVSAKHQHRLRMDKQVWLDEKADEGLRRNYKRVAC